MATAPAYGSRPIRALRRSPATMALLKQVLVDVLAADHPMTVRQCFYRLVSLGVIAKTEQEYKSTVVRLLGELRREGRIPYAWLADNTRWMRKPTTYSSLRQMLARSIETYRRAVWDSQASYVEIWLEKDALSGVLYEVTETWDVPLMVTRGYPSLTFLHSAADAIAAQGKPTAIYYLGDHDPSGVDIPRKVEREIRTFAPGVPLTFERVAVLPEQIAVWGLPTRPTKTTDSRSRDFDGESVEVDAIPPQTLRALVEACITRHVDPAALGRLAAVEQQERVTLSILENALDHLEG